MIRWCWTGEHGAVQERRAADTEAAAPAFANVALVVGSTGTVGAALVDMLQSTDAPAGPWKVYALCRRPLPPWCTSGSAASTSSPNAVVVSLQVDLANAAAVAAALAPLADITHVFYAAWSPQRGSPDAVACETNRAMLRNVLSAVVPSCPALAHVCLQTGRDQFVDPFDPVMGTTSATRPYSEDLPRLEHPDLEDVLLIELPGFVASRRDRAPVTWSVHRPATVFGFSSRSGRNVVSSLCVYAAICRKEGAALRWPGSRVAWEGFSDASDAELVAEHALWAALELRCKNEAFNCTNGDVFKWKQLWPALAKHFAVEWSGYDGEDKRFKLEEAMAGKEAVWTEIVRENGLLETKLDDTTTWWSVDAVLNADQEQVDTMNKSKELGFFGFRHTVRSFDTWITKLKASGIVP
ncbi:3-oxo-Delta(4,5)-steroid 5-beta-reductase-like [Panicum hallii]|jgi:Delta4-3-oxosteroid 5beta-reductase|uniref:3-oxo-Delta(4,5)-steroid 5-beta-reductase-like n=1 Tax=Panicum hallii TaxID=206008 RepID=UPI000DF4D794|nr:3-oxo-Delta(4,5)-steroid 5-beta-reductase-like [Panicum hallii]